MLASKGSLAHTRKIHVNNSCLYVLYQTLDNGRTGEENHATFSRLWWHAYVRTRLEARALFVMQVYM